MRRFAAACLAAVMLTAACATDDDRCYPGEEFCTEQFAPLVR